MQGYLLIPSFLHLGDLAHRSAAFGEGGFLSLPHCEEVQADFHLRDRGVGMWQEKWEEVAQSYPELQVGRCQWALRARSPTRSNQN
jgi:hypothetical protein